MGARWATENSSMVLKPMEITPTSLLSSSASATPTSSSRAAWKKAATVWLVTMTLSTSAAISRSRPLT
jgi:hypothetical protein